MDPSTTDPLIADSLDVGDTRFLAEQKYYDDWEAAVRRDFPKGMTLEHIWDGAQANPNAFLTILRHGRSATVHHGAVGGVPETAWVLNYANFERLYYNLVAVYRPWGHILHKLDAWTSMSFVRYDGEANFLSFLQPALRIPLRDAWRQGLGKAVAEKVSFDLSSVANGIRPSEIVVDPANPIADFAQKVSTRLGETTANLVDPLNPHTPAALPTAVDDLPAFERGLASLRGKDRLFAQFVPNTTVIRADGHIYTLVANRGYLFHNNVLEKRARAPWKDQVFSVRDAVPTNYPELFVDIDLSASDSRDPALFFKELSQVATRAAWDAFEDKWAIARNTQSFWDFYHELNDWNLAQNPVDAGILDISEYEWPASAGHSDDEKALMKAVTRIEGEGGL